MKRQIDMLPFLLEVLVKIEDCTEILTFSTQRISIHIIRLQIVSSTIIRLYVREIFSARNTEEKCLVYYYLVLPTTLRLLKMYLI